MCAVLAVLLLAPAAPVPKPTDAWLGRSVFPKTPAVRPLQTQPDGTERAISTGYRYYRVIADTGERVRVFAGSDKPTWLLKSSVLRAEDAVLHFAAQIKEANADGADARLLAQLHSNRGWAEAECGRHAAALKAHDNAVELAPNEPYWRWGRAQALAAAGRPADALADAQAAAKLRPNDPSGRYYTGWLLMQNDKLTEADEELTLAVAANGGASFRLMRATVREKQGRFADALEDVAEAERADPESVSVWNHTAWLLAIAPDAKLRNGKRAVQLATKAVEASGWRDGTYLDTLAAAYAEVGRFADAAAVQERALADPKFAGREADEGRQRLEMYRRRTPFRAK